MFQCGPDASSELLSERGCFLASDRIVLETMEDSPPEWMETEPPGCSLPSWLSVQSAGMVSSLVALHLDFHRLLPDQGPMLLIVIIHFPDSKFRVYWWPLMVSFQFGCSLWVCRLIGPEMLWTAEYSQGWRNLGDLNPRGQNKCLGHFLDLFTPVIFGHL